MLLIGSRQGLAVRRKTVLGNATLNPASSRSKKFPLAEGIGIFIGILAWDLLSEGRLDPLKALLIAVPCALVWYAIRCRKHDARKLRH
jgi:hypothetical protein